MCEKELAINSVGTHVLVISAYLIVCQFEILIYICVNIFTSLTLCRCITIL